MKRFALLALAFTIATFHAAAQPDGLWLVTRVDVGTEVMTPVAKWFRFSNGRHVSGNGWQQHTFGTYTWNPATSELSLTSENEPDDGYGAFSVVRNGNSMTWTRKEDGDDIKVHLTTVTELPRNTADEVKGFWGLVKATRSGADVTHDIDPEGRQYIFIRWDRVYVRRLTSKEKVQGYWFMHGHRPELKLIREQNQQDNETWSVSFVDRNLILTGVSDNVKGMVLAFTRKAEYEN